MATITRDNYLDAERYLSRLTYSAADTETYGLEYTDAPFSVIAGDSDSAFYYNLKDYPSGQKAVGENEIDSLKRIFLDPNITWFFHNAKFDMHKLAQLGIEIAGTVWDCKAMQRLIQNNLLDYSLDSLTRGQENTKSAAVDTYVKEHKLHTKRRVEGKKKIVTDKHYDQVPFEIISEYGERDVKATFELGMSQVKILAEIPEMHELRDTELALTKALYRMEKNGIMIDPDIVRNEMQKEISLIREADKDFLSLYGLSYEGITKKELVKILTDEGETISLTDKGNPSLDGDALDSMTCQAAKIVNRIRHFEKRISSFYSSFLYFRDSQNTIHPNADQAGTETGRLSMSSPNLQQLSKDGKDDGEGFPIRGCFKPRPGRCFVQWDWKQQEYKLMADYANEYGLIDKIKAGHDVHQATADLVGCSRDYAKTVNFAILYGAGPKKLALMLGITEMEARKLIDRYFSALPKVEDFIARVIWTGRGRGYIYNWAGRRFHIANREWAYILPNHLIQGSGADVMKKAFVQVDELLLRYKAQSKIVLTVHDSFILEMVAEEYDIIPEITEIMESVYPSKNGIILTTDLEHSFKSLSKKDLVKGAPTCDLLKMRTTEHGLRQ